MSVLRRNLRDSQAWKWRTASLGLQPGLEAEAARIARGWLSRTFPRFDFRLVVMLIVRVPKSLCDPFRQPLLEAMHQAVEPPKPPAEPAHFAGSGGGKEEDPEGKEDNPKWYR
jgi:hypothetical protein